MDDVDEIIRSARSRIKSFRAGVKDMEQRISEYERLISRGGDGYDVDALAASNDHAREQIGRFEQEISRAETLIEAAGKMRETLELKAALAEGVIIDADAYD